MTDYQKMCYVLMDAAERAVSLLEEATELSGQKASALLVEGALLCEEIYIQTSEDS